VKSGKKVRNRMLKELKDGFYGGRIHF